MSVSGTVIGNLVEVVSADEVREDFQKLENSNDPVQAWAHVVSSIKQKLDKQIFMAFVEPLRFIGMNLEKNEVIISAPSKLVSDTIEKNYKERFLDLLKENLSESNLGLKIIVEVREADPENSKTRAVYRVPAPKPVALRVSKSDSSASGINPRYTFQNFVVGNNNEFCQAAAQRVAENPGMNYNPLFIYGGVGLGKTHLLHAIGNAALARDPNLSILYISSEMFVNELITALRNGKMDEFKRKYRKIDILLIDDIQFISGKERTQEEFFHTFNTLHSAKRQIVITSDKIPQDIPGIEERLQTRFAWGLTADLQAPDFETRVAIINRKAGQEGLLLSSDAANLIAENFSSNVRELEGALNRLIALRSFQNDTSKELSAAFAESALKPLLQPKNVNITISDIKKVVAEHFTLKISDLSSARRTRNLSFPRHIAMYLCRKHTTASYPEIGGSFGGRDHSSVIHAANVVAKKLANSPDLKLVLENIEKVLRAS